MSDEFIPSLHSFTGELPVTLPNWNQTIDARVITTTQQLTEFPYNQDISGINNDLLGIGWAQSSMSGGNRASSSTSYLADANERPNLTVLINAMVTKLLPTDSSAAVKSFLNVQFSDARTMLGNCSVLLSVLFMLRCTVTPQPPLHFKYRQTKRSSYLLDP